LFAVKTTQFWQFAKQGHGDDGANPGGGLTVAVAVLFSLLVARLITETEKPDCMSISLSSFKGAKRQLERQAVFFSVNFIPIWGRNLF
jgi:hypothetical protein